jgi:glycyl-tRNA synthetase
VRHAAPDPAGERYDAVQELLHRRGLVFRAAEAYSVERSGWNWGPLGVELRENLRRLWWHAVVHSRDDMVGLDTPYLIMPKVHEVDGRPALTTDVGERLGDDGRRVLRPDLAQSVLVDLHAVLDTTRRTLPFGVAQTGKVFRPDAADEPLFSGSEIDLMTLHYFVAPGEDGRCLEHWVEQRRAWWTSLGIPPSELQLQARTNGAPGVSMQFRFGLPGQEWAELEAIIGRGDVDLTEHSSRSGVDLSYADRPAGSRYRPSVVQASTGLGRGVLALLLAGYEDEPAVTAVGAERRGRVRLDPRLAPMKVAVLPETRSPELTPRALDLADELRRHWTVDLDESGSLGRRMRRQDEIGTPVCVIVDFDTGSDGAVGIREHGGGDRFRVPASMVVDAVAARLRLP